MKTDWIERPWWNSLNNHWILRNMICRVKLAIQLNSEKLDKEIYENKTWASSAQGSACNWTKKGNIMKTKGFSLQETKTLLIVWMTSFDTIPSNLSPIQPLLYPTPNTIGVESKPRKNSISLIKVWCTIFYWTFLICGMPFYFFVVN